MVVAAADVAHLGLSRLAPPERHLGWTMSSKAALGLSTEPPAGRSSYGDARGSPSVRAMRSVSQSRPGALASLLSAVARAVPNVSARAMYEAP